VTEYEFKSSTGRVAAPGHFTASRRPWTFGLGIAVAVAAVALLAVHPGRATPPVTSLEPAPEVVEALPELAALGAPPASLGIAAGGPIADCARFGPLGCMASPEDDPALPVERVTLEVEVVDPRGRAVPGAVVQATWAEWRTKGYTADEAGRLVMRVPHGTRGLEVVGRSADDDRRLLLVHYHALAPGDDTARVVVRLGSEISGVLVDDSGAPIPHAFVGAVPSAFGFSSVQTDEAGAFNLGVLDGSEVDVDFGGAVSPPAAPDVETRRRGAVRRVPSGTRGVRIVATPVEFESTLRARFLLDDGTPASRFEVVYTAGGGTHGLSAWTDESGRVTIDGQPDWPVQVGVEPPRVCIEEGVTEDEDTYVALLSRLGTRWEVDGLMPDGAEHVVRLAPRTLLRGVVRRRDGSPVATALCAAFQGSDVLATCSTDGEGRFLTVLPVRPGTVIQLCARDKGDEEEGTARGVRSDIVAGYEQPTIVLEEIGPLLAPSRRPAPRIPGLGLIGSPGSQ
jgi:hypothetical protein